MRFARGLANGWRIGLGLACALGSAAVVAETPPVIFIDAGQRLGTSNSSAVALGDLDWDGDLDAFVANHGGADRIWLNDGAGVFFDSGQSLGNGDSSDVALGDLDGDSDLDAFVADFSGPDRVWLNNGSGLFMDSGQTLGSTDSSSVSLVDLDGDGDLDAYVTQDPDDSGFQTMWINDGSGVFSIGSTAGGYGGIAPRAATGDLDGDTDIDGYVVRGYTGGADLVMLNDGAGAFSPGGSAPGVNSRNVALGDLDGDDDLDAFITVTGISGSEPSKVYLNNGSAVFTDSGQSLGSSNSAAVALGDLDGDGDLDAFVVSWAADSVWINDGNALYSGNGQALSGTWNSDVALGDVDGDGDLDGVVTTNGPNTVWLNVSHSIFSDGLEVGDVSRWTLSGTDGPRVAGVDPTNGITAGGDQVVITGSGFTGTSAVLLDGTSCATWSVLDDQRILCETPAHAVGPVRVTVWRGAAHATSLEGFRYTESQSPLVTWAQLTHPATLTCATGTLTGAISGHIQGSGLTDGDGPPGPMVRGEIGWGPYQTVPGQTPGWRWVRASWTADQGVVDEFRGALVCPDPGTYSYAFRGSADGGLLYRYGDLPPGSADGLDVNDLGVMTAQ